MLPGEGCLASGSQFSNDLDDFFQAGNPPPGVDSRRLPFPALIFIERAANPCGDH
jgi:hypothetical protein